MEMCCINSK